MWSTDIHIPNRILCIALPFYTLKCDMNFFRPYLFYRAVYWHVKISNVRFIIMHRVNSLTHIRFVSVYVSVIVIGPFSISWTMSENCYHWVTALYLLSLRLSLFVLSLSTICLSMSLSLIYLPHLVVVFCSNGDECVSVCLFFHRFNEMWWCLRWSERMKKNPHYLYSEWSARCRSIRQRLMKCTR